MLFIHLSNSEMADVLFFVVFFFSSKIKQLYFIKTLC